MVVAKHGGKPEEVGGEWGQERQKILIDSVETYSEGIWLPKDLILLSEPITMWRRGFLNERTEGLPLQDWHWIQNQREMNGCQVPRCELNGVHGVSQGRWGCSGRMRKEPYWVREPAKSNLEFIVCWSYQKGAWVDTQRTEEARVSSLGVNLWKSVCRNREQMYGYQGGRGWGTGKLGLTVCVKQTTDGNIACSTRNYN